MGVDGGVEDGAALAGTGRDDGALVARMLCGGGWRGGEESEKERQDHARPCLVAGGAFVAPDSRRLSQSFW